MIASSIEKIASVSAMNVRKDIPVFDVGDTVKMKIKVKEAEFLACLEEGMAHVFIACLELGE